MYLECLMFYAIKGAHFEATSKTILQTLETQNVEKQQRAMCLSFTKSRNTL